MKQFTTVMKALSDPNRVTILKLLEDRELCVCELQALLGLAQPTVSKHIRVLEDAGLVVRERDRMWTNFRLAGEGAPSLVASMLAELRGALNDEPSIVALRKQLPFTNRESLCSTSNQSAA